MSIPAPSLRLGFAGTPGFAVSALDALHASNHEVRAVFTQPDRPAGRGRAVQMSPVKQRALELGISVHQPASFKSDGALSLLGALQLDALVVVAYGSILPAAALALPKLGCFNIHASLLPRWRGAAPIQRAILAGDEVSGVTIMRMDPGLDTGPILSSRAVDISARDTAGSLHDRLASLGGELICEALDALAAGTAHETVQPASGATYAAKINKSDALIDWRDDAQQVVRQVRALNPTPVAETRLDGAQLRIFDAAPVASERGARANAAPGTVESGAEGILVDCGSGRVRILRLQLAGRNALAAEEFVKARPLIGARFTNP